MFADDWWIKRRQVMTIDIWSPMGCHESVSPMYQALSCQSKWDVISISLDYNRKPYAGLQCRNNQKQLMYEWMCVCVCQPCSIWSSQNLPKHQTLDRSESNQFLLRNFRTIYNIHQSTLELPIKFLLIYPRLNTTNCSRACVINYCFITVHVLSEIPTH